MTKELFRLPLLWTSPERRPLIQKRMCKFTKEKEKDKFLFSIYQFIHIDIEKTKLEKYIEGFNYVYQYYDKSIAHETNFGRI